VAGLEKKMKKDESMKEKKEKKVVKCNNARRHGKVGNDN
jgi:hypothetical protein